MQGEYHWHRHENDDEGGQETMNIPVHEYTIIHGYCPAPRWVSHPQSNLEAATTPAGTFVSGLGIQYRTG